MLTNFASMYLRDKKSLKIRVRSKFYLKKNSFIYWFVEKKRQESSEVNNLQQISSFLYEVLNNLS